MEIKSKHQIEHDFAMLHELDVQRKPELKVPNSPFSVLTALSNPDRNRYTNILPYEKNRVKLISESRNDYINASYVRGIDGTSLFIATQGPLQNTAEHFWQMIMQENVDTIVMLANVVEGTWAKCLQYWPLENITDCKTISFGQVSIELVESRMLIECESVERILKVYSGAGGNDGDSKVRIVRQFHYTAWPDHGVPKTVVPILNLIETVNMSRNNVEAPVVVHCRYISFFASYYTIYPSSHSSTVYPVYQSAGVGRTGTYCALDILQKMLKNKDNSDFKDEKLDAVMRVVGNLREQRQCMVEAFVSSSI